MPSIEELLPLLDGLKETYYAKSNVVLSPGQYHQWVAEHEGWLVYAMGRVNQRHATISHNIWIYPLEFTPFILNLYGFTLPNDGTIWISHYDEVFDQYFTQYTPRPYKRFHAGDYLRITAPTRNPITGLPITTDTILDLGLILVYIINKDKFQTSLKDIFGGKSH
jgi:hypothetical protein